MHNRVCACLAGYKFGFVPFASSYSCAAVDTSLEISTKHRFPSKLQLKLFYVFSLTLVANLVVGYTVRFYVGYYVVYKRLTET